METWDCKESALDAFMRSVEETGFEKFNRRFVFGTVGCLFPLAARRRILGEEEILNFTISGAINSSIVKGADAELIYNDFQRQCSLDNSCDVYTFHSSTTPSPLASAAAKMGVCRAFVIVALLLVSVLRNH
jgi:hypothetical protein